MGMKKAYMVVGCPGSGKSWVCGQLREAFHYVPHDDHRDTNKYLAAIVRASDIADKPLLIETPFSMSQILEPLQTHGFSVHCVFIQEDEGVIEGRYRAREGKQIPAGHIARQRTYAERARTMQAFAGTSGAVLSYLKNEAPNMIRYPWES